MPKKRFIAEQIVTLLRKTEVSMVQENSPPGNWCNTFATSGCKLLINR